MNLKLSTAFIFFYTLVFSQKYHFNYYTLYKSELRSGKEVEHMNHESVFNSVDHTYNLNFDLKSKKNPKATIMDSKNGFIHFFKLKNINFPIKSEDFEYLYSTKLPSLKNQMDDEFNRRFFKTELLEESPEHSKFSIQECKNENLTKCNEKIDLILVEYKDDLVANGLTYALDYLDIGKKVKFDKKYILQSSTRSYKGRTQLLTLIDVKPLDINLEIVPGKIVLK